MKLEEHSPCWRIDLGARLNGIIVPWKTKTFVMLEEYLWGQLRVEIRMMLDDELWWSKP